MDRFPIYPNLVENKGDLVGLIAYSLYKQDKFSFVAAYRAAKNAEPDDDAMESFCRASNLPDRIRAYRETAEKVLETFNGDLLESAIDEVRGDYQQEFATEVKKLKTPSLSRNIFEHAIAGFLVWCVVGSLLLVALVVKNGVPHALRSIAGWPSAAEASVIQPEARFPPATKHGQ